MAFLNSYFLLVTHAAVVGLLFFALLSKLSTVLHDFICTTVLDQQKMCLYFLDEMSLAAAQQVNLSRLNVKTCLFVDQTLSEVYVK